MSNDEFTRLFKYIEEFRGEVNDKFSGVDRRFDAVEKQIDGLTKMITDYHQELLALSSKVDRLERAILKIAKETGVELDYSSL